MRKTLLGAAALLAASLAAGAAQAQTAEVRIAVRTDVSSIDPHYHAYIPNRAISRHIFDSLTALSPRGEVRPGLAASWKVLQEDVWEFSLRDAAFHDGSRMTAEDVAFTFVRAPDVPNSPSSYRTFMKSVDSVEVIDPRTVRIRTKGPAPTLLVDIEAIAILSKAAAEGRATSDFNAGRAANGTGPFKLTSWSPGAPQLLTRNEAYWGEKPHWANLRIVPIARDPARVAALLAGDVDFINRVPIADVPRLKSDAKLRLFSGPSAYVYMVYTEVGHDQPQGVKDNAGNPLAQNPWRDPRVRQALSLAINRDALVDRVMEGLAVKMTQPVPDGMFGASPRIPPAAFNVERARALMAEAGFPQGFQAELSCPNDRFPNDSKICEAVAQQFSRIGLKITVASYPSAVFFSRRARREFGLTMAGWGSLTGEASYFFSAVIHTADREKNLGSINTNGISDAEIDPLIQRARNMLDETGRRALLEQVSEMVVQRNLVIPTLAFGTVSAGRADRVTYTTRQDEEIQAIEIKPAR